MAGVTILILEDELNLAYTLSRALEKHLGTESTIKICNIAEAALQLLHIYTFDLIITDCRLPAMSGLEFITQMRQSFCDVPVIFMTAFGTATIEEQVQEISDVYLTKPFEVSELIYIARQLLDLYRVLPQSGRSGKNGREKLSSSRLLILEDDQKLLALYQKAFQKTGFVVHPARTAEEADILLDQYHFDIFVCDILIENERSLQLLQQREDILWKNGTKVFVITEAPWHRLTSEDIKANFFIRKPVEMVPLISLAKSLVPSQRKDSVETSNDRLF
jgi:DNA-binding response OmpR family regulator